ncbi:hypothetical protein GF377_03685, partial [candidate division GN15 bacterium]|nr:hypothetical protein [candidate division GN15 bacterium]
MGRLFRIFTLVGAICLCGTIPALAQRDHSDREAIDTLFDRLVIQLDQRDRELADEYLDILEQVQDLVEDYRAELEDIEEITNDSHDESLDHLRNGLRSDRYVDDPQLLMDDITLLIQDLKDIESEQKTIHNTNRPKSARVVRNLRRNLVMMIELIEDYTDTNARKLLRRDDMREYIEVALGYAREAMEYMSDSVRIELEGVAEAMNDIEVIVT